VKGFVVFDTSYDNTRAIAAAIAESLRQWGIEADAAYVKDLKKVSAAENDFLVIGSPTRFGTASFAVKRFLSRLSEEEWHGKPFAAFDTELAQNIENAEGSAGERIASSLKEKRMVQLLPVLKSVVLATRGYSLREGEIARARQFAETLASALRKRAS
jgi:menaquinone-dependent protoporphyrinogen IX oxidase